MALISRTLISCEPCSKSSTGPLEMFLSVECVIRDDWTAGRVALVDPRPGRGLGAIPVDALRS